MTSRPLQLEQYSSLGEYIRSYRVWLDLSQRELAEGSEVSGATAISLIENGLVMPNFSTALRILNFLRVKGAPAIDLCAITQQRTETDPKRYERENDEAPEREAVAAEWEPSRE